MRRRHVYLWCSMPAGQPLLQGKTVELMVCSSDRTLGLLNLAVGADSNGFLGTHTHARAHTRVHTIGHNLCNVGITCTVHVHRGPHQSLTRPFPHWAL